MATGEVFEFLNADDLLLPGSLERVAAFFRLNPNCDLALGNGVISLMKGASRPAMSRPAASRSSAICMVARDGSSRLLFSAAKHFSDRRALTS